MKEKDLRSLHGRIGIFLAFFIMLQAASGLFITMGEIEAPHSHAGKTPVAADAPVDTRQPPAFQAALAAIHHGGGTTGVLYRIFLSMGLLWMAVSGGLIYFKIRARAPSH